jgi:gamma-glutamylcyclotransferase
MEIGSSCQVFAYGSNLHLSRMRERCPSAEPIAIGSVRRRKIAFHKRSVDGSAKADAAFSDDEQDRVWGAVYRINSDDKAVLDRHESLGIGYDLQRVNVESSGNLPIEAWLYVARREVIDGSLFPYSWYVDFVLRGASQHRLPWCYINVQLRVSSIVDPDIGRRQGNRQILDRLAGAKTCPSNDGQYSPGRKI